MQFWLAYARLTRLLRRHRRDKKLELFLFYICAVVPAYTTEEYGATTKETQRNHNQILKFIIPCAVSQAPLWSKLFYNHSGAFLLSAASVLELLTVSTFRKIQVNRFSINKGGAPYF